MTWKDRGEQLWIAFTAAPFLGVLVLMLWPVSVLPQMGIAPGYTLAAPDGSPYSHVDFVGQPLLYALVPPDCAACQTGLTHLPSAVSAADLPLPLAFIALHAGGEEVPLSGSWLHLFPRQGQGYGMVREGFDRVLAANRRQPMGQGRMQLFLVDPAGIVRGEYAGGQGALTRETATRLQQDLTLLAQEMRAQDSPLALIYATRHLFLCSVQ